MRIKSHRFLCHPYHSWEFHDSIKYQCPDVTLPKCRRFCRALIWKTSKTNASIWKKSIQSALTPGSCHPKTYKHTPCGSPMLSYPFSVISTCSIAAVQAISRVWSPAVTTRKSWTGGSLENNDWQFELNTSMYIWVFPKIGVPQNGWFITEKPIKMDDLGVPPFSETPICLYNFPKT